MIYSRQQKLIVVIAGVVVGYLAWRRRRRMLRKIRRRRVINTAVANIILKWYICMKQRVSIQKLYYSKSGPKTNWFSSLYESSTEASFQIMFRFDKAEFDNLVLDLDEHLNSQFSDTANVEIRLNRRILSNREVVALITLLWLTGPSKITRLANLFGVGSSVAHKYIIHCVLGICSVLRNEITWPQQNQRDLLKAKAAQLYGEAFAGCIGAVDGTDFEIPRPEKNQQVWYSRKKRHVVKATAIVDMDGHFIYVKIGDFGSMHDANCFQRTNLWQNVHLFFSEDENILADSAYSDRAFCVTPYPLHAEMHHCTFEHSRLRVIVFHA